MEYKTITVCDQDQWESGPMIFAGTLDEAIEALAKIRESIPEEYRKDATFRISSNWDRDDCLPSVCITYQALVEPPKLTEQQAAEAAHWREEIRQAAARLQHARVKYDDAMNLDGRKDLARKTYEEAMYGGRST